VIINKVKSEKRKVKNEKRKVKNETRYSQRPVPRSLRRGIGGQRSAVSSLERWNAGTLEHWNQKQQSQHKY
jgi:hypothetical protein